jgi:hypothetical protein
LLQENTHQNVVKAEEWKTEARLQEELFDAIYSDDEYNF